MLCLSEIMQNTDNEVVGYVTPHFTGIVGKYLQEILAQMAMKYFGYAREVAYASDFALKPEDFTNYDPNSTMLSVEMSTERPPDQWWPTTNDLSLIRALPITKALPLAKRWPSGPDFYSGDPSAFPGTGQAGTDANTTGGSTGSSGGPTNSSSFIGLPGQAP
jgi:hypothetical protein